MAITLDAIEYPPGSGTYQSIGSGTSYGGRFLAERPYSGLTGAPAEIGRAGAPPSFQSISIGNRQIPITFPTLTTTALQADIYKWFNPSARDSSGDTTRYLRCTWHDGTTTIRVPVNVVSVTPRSRFADVVDVVVQATWPYFEKTTAETQATVGVDTPSNGGNVDAPVLLSFSTSTGAIPDSAYEFAITETGGIGVSEVPVLLDVGGAFLTESKTYVFDQYGVSKPFVVVSSRYVWTTVSVGPNETVNMYVFEDAAFTTNPMAGSLEWGEFYTSNTSNTSQEQDGFQISNNPSRTGLWHPQRLAFTGGGGTSWGYSSSEGSTDLVYTISDTSEAGRNDANGMVVVTGIPADSITGLSRVTANHSSDIRSFVRYRQAGQTGWSDAWTQTGNATVTSTITLVDAVEIVAGIEVTGVNPTNGATLTLSGTGTPDITVNLDTAKDLTVSRTLISSNCGLLNGTLTNSTTGQVITFDDLIYYDTTDTSEILYIDFRHDAEKRLYSRDTSNGFIFGADGAISFSDPIGGFGLAPGSNTISQSLTGTVTVTVDWRNTYG